MESSTSVDQELRTVTCTVCDEDFKQTSATVSNDCKHGASTCKACLNTWIKRRIEDFGKLEIDCSDCHAVLHHNDIFKWASKLVFDR